MAGKSDASDDLIAELAKLMAQDARSDKPVEPSRPVSPVRIPGSDIPPAPAPRFDFARTPPAAETPVPASEAEAETPEPPAAQPADEPFRFDFGLVAPKPAVAAEPEHEAEVRPAVSEFVPLRTTTPPPPAAASPDPSFTPVDHDSIADLIAAELQGDSEPQLEPTPPGPSVSTEPRPAPQPSAGWAPTPVSANLATADQPVRPAMRPVNLQPGARPEQDRFKVAPVFGLGSGTPEAPVAPVVNAPIATPAPSAPVRAEPSFRWPQSKPATAPEPAPADEDDGIGRDPIDEIESLIGRAVRVELDAPVVPAAAVEKAAPSPALRSLATPTAPPASSRGYSSADETILAAAQATGVEIGWVDTPEAQEVPPVAPRRVRTFRAPGMTRALAGPLVAVTLLLAAGFGLYWVLGLGRDSGPAPLLTADATPTKETPVVDPDAPAAQQSVVFNEIDGVVPGAEEQLVSRDQSDLNEVAQVPPVADVSAEGLANRKVRTVTVRPDGTIVSGDDSVAGSNILPVDRPNVPAVPGADTATPELLASTQPVATTPAETPAATPVPAEPAATVAPVTPVTPGTSVAAVDLAGNALPGRTTIIPLTRPAGLAGPGASEVTAPTSPVNAVVNTPVSGGNMLPPPPGSNTLGAAPAIAAPAQPLTAIPGAVEVDALPNSAAAYAQLASLRSEEEARQAAQGLVARFGPLFGGANMEVQRVDLGERGIYYRVRVPAESTQAAGSICTNVIAAGGDCVPM